MAVTTWQESFRAWKERLLQLDRRNTLLYFKPNRAVRIVDRDPDQIVEELVSKRGGLAFDFVEPRRKLAEPPERPDRPGDLHSDLPLLDLQRRLGALRTRDRQYEEEQGLNVLFLAVGVLHWIDADDERAQAPLILIPCDLERASPRDPYYLVRESDDAGDNATLRYKLSLEHLDLPEFADEPPSAYLHRVKRVIRRRRGWEVSPDIYLATLSYSKIAMHQDLDQAEREGIDHPLVLQLAGSSEVDRHDDLPKALLPGDAELAGGGPTSASRSLPMIGSAVYRFRAMPTPSSPARILAQDLDRFWGDRSQSLMAGSSAGRPSISNVRRAPTAQPPTVSGPTTLRMCPRSRPCAGPMQDHGADFVDVGCDPRAWPEAFTSGVSRHRHVASKAYP